MTFWQRLMTGCVFGHESDPLRRLDAKGRLVWECRRCQRAIKVVLPGQKFKARKAEKIVQFPRERKRA